MRRGGPCRSKVFSMPEANLTVRVPVPSLRPRSCRGSASTCSVPICSSPKRFPEASGARCGRSQAHLPALALSRRGAKPGQPKLSWRPGRSRAASPPKRAHLRVLPASPTEVGGACRAPFRLPHASPKLPVRSNRAEACLLGASHRGEPRREELESLRSSGPAPTVSRACLSLDAPSLARALSRRSGSSCVPVPVMACASPEGAA